MKRRTFLRNALCTPVLVGVGLGQSAGLANASSSFCNSSSSLLPYDPSLFETRVFTVNPAGGGNYSDLVTALNAIEQMPRDRRNRIRIDLADGVYNLDSHPTDIAVPAYTRIRGNVQFRKKVKVERLTTDKTLFLGSGSVVEGLSVVNPTEGGQLITMKDSYPEPSVIQYCKLQGGVDTLIVGDGCIGYMYDVNYVATFDGVRGHLGTEAFKPIRLTMAYCTGIILGFGRGSLVRNGLTANYPAPEGSLFDIYGCTFTRNQSDQTIMMRNGGSVVGATDETKIGQKHIPIRMKDTTCSVVVPNLGGSASIVRMYKARFEIENCQFNIMQMNSTAPYIVNTVLLEQDAQGYILDGGTNHPGWITDAGEGGVSVIIDPAL